MILIYACNKSGISVKTDNNSPSKLTESNLIGGWSITNATTSVSSSDGRNSTQMEFPTKFWEFKSDGKLYIQYKAGQIAVSYKILDGNKMILTYDHVTQTMVVKTEGNKLILSEERILKNNNNYEELIELTRTN